jgi:hypothetical protein
MLKYIVCFLILSAHALVVAQAQIPDFLKEKCLRKAFPRAPEMESASYQTAIIGDILDNQYGLGNPSATFIEDVLIKILGGEKIKTIHRSHPEMPILNFLEINNSRDSVFSFQNPKASTLLITGKIGYFKVYPISTSVKRKTSTSFSRGYQQTTEYTYHLSGRMMLQLKFIDFEQRKLIANETVTVLLDYEKKSPVASYEVNQDDLNQFHKIIEKNHPDILGRFFSNFETRKLKLMKRGFFESGEKRKAELLLDSGKNEEALEILRSFSRKKSSIKKQAESCYNLAIAQLCSFRFDSADHYINQSINLFPGKLNFENLKAIIGNERVLYRNFLNNHKKSDSLRSALAANTKRAARESDNIRIYLLIAANADYENPALIDLKSSENDALLLKDAFSLNLPNNKETEIRFLAGKQLTRASLIKTLNEICGKAAPADLIFLYLNMHGIAGPEGKEVYLLPGNTDPENIEGTAVSDQEIERILSKSTTQKRLIAADAVHGKVFAAKDNTEMYEVPKILFQNTVRNKINGVFNSCSAYEKSLEMLRSGKHHGYFTYYLSEGIKSAADRDHDFEITLQEALDYTSEKVSSASGSKQHPLAEGLIHQSFPLNTISQ